MSSRRMIDPAFWQSESMAKMSFRQRLLFIGLFSNADDQGRLRAHPSLVRSTIFPFDEVAGAEIQSDLEQIAAVGSIILYDIDGKQHLQIANWWRYQHPRWAWPSDIPAPNGWMDRLRYRIGNEVTQSNWEGEDEAEPEQSQSGPTVDSLRDHSDPIVGPEWDQSEIVQSGRQTVPIPAPSIRTRTRDSDRSSGSGESEPSSSFFAEAMGAYHNTIGMVSSLQADEIGAYLTELRDKGLESWWPAALKVAADQNVRKWAYVKAVIDKCLDENHPPGAGNGRNGGKAKEAPDAKHYISGEYAEFIQH